MLFDGEEGMTIKWTHILDAQPEDETIIIQIDRPYDCYKSPFTNHYTMCMKKYEVFMSFNSYLKFQDEEKLPYPDFFWCYAKDFPFPVFEEPKQ